jgi:glycerophosphoryl diester phosphodiesterase
MTGPAASLLQIRDSLPIVIAHRGASGHAPENTLAAYRKAIELGALVAETDVFLSRDGRVVAIHDETLDRTTNGKGRVDDHSFEELRALDAGSWFHQNFADETLPELGELLDLIDKRMVLCIEIKDGEGIEAAIQEILDSHDARGHVIFFSFNPDKIKITKTLMPEVPSLFLVHVDEAPWRYPSDLVEEAVSLGADAIGVSGRGAHTVDIAQAHKAGLPVFVYTINELDDVDAMLQLGVDGIITNFPRRTYERVHLQQNSN